MKKVYIVILLIFYSVTTTFAYIPDSISSLYKVGKFETHYQSRTKVSQNIASDMADYLVSDFHNSPGHLFNWALKDLGLQNKNNELIIVFKSSSHSTKTGITHGVFDIVVPHFTTFNDVKVDAIVSKTESSNGVIKVTANIVYSSLLLKNALGVITLIPQNNDLLLVTNVKINFGWFFNLFITQKRYKSIVEWRIKKFTENIVNELERRKELEVKKLK